MTSAEGIDPQNERRIALTVAADDTVAIPKVEGAGEVVTRGGVEVQVMHNGVVVEHGGYHGAWMAEIIRRLRGHHEPQEELAFHTVVERLRRDGVDDAVMIELGGFWSFYSLWFQRMFPGGRNVIIEPDPSNLALAHRNLALNDMHADVVQAAVGARDGETVRLVCESDGVERDLPTASVDGLIARFDLPRVDLLLVDVQGAELEALQGAADAVARHAVRFLVVSTHHHRISGDPLIHERCLRQLLDWGAHVIVEHTIEESSSGDGLIVASLDPRDRDLHLEVTRVRARDSLFGGLWNDLAEAQEALDLERSAAEALRAQIADASTATAPQDDRTAELGAELQRVRENRDELHAELARVREDRDRLHAALVAGRPGGRATVAARLRGRRGPRS